MSLKFGKAASLFSTLWPVIRFSVEILGSGHFSLSAAPLDVLVLIYQFQYDTGAGASLINFSADVSLGQDLDTVYQPFVKNASEEDMGTLDQITCTFTINNQPFTQSFIVCKPSNDPLY